MRLVLAALLVLTATVPAMADKDRVVEWRLASAEGKHYYMPPDDCLVGPLPPHEIVFLSQAEMNQRWPTNNKDDPDRYGMTFFARSDANPLSRALVFVSADLPPKVLTDMIKHEMAHLRGCQHPGYTTNSDGTPAR